MSVLRWSSHPRLALLTAAFALLLASPALLSGWILDDSFHRLVMLGKPPLQFSPFEIFGAAEGGTARAREFLDRGVLPWWTPPDFHLSFFRPLAVLSSWLEYRLWPDSPVLMHAHNLALYAGLIVTGFVFYRSLIPAKVAGGLAGVFFALDQAHAMPAVWIASRHALLAGIFGILSLYAYHRYRSGPARWGGLAAPFFLALSLASGELAVGALGYFAGYALFVERGGLRARVIPLVPCALVTLAWAVVYQSAGFGATAGGTYVDPLKDAGAYASTFLERAPWLLFSEWSTAPADILAVAPAGQSTLFLTAGLLFLAPIAVMLWILVRRDPISRMFAFGMGFAVFSASAAMSSSRVLMFVALGAAGLLGRLVSMALAPDPDDERPQLAGMGRGFVIALAVLHLVISPLTLPLALHSLTSIDHAFVSATDELRLGASVENTDLIIINPRDQLYTVTYYLIRSALAGEPLPRRVRILAAEAAALRIERADERTLLVQLGAPLQSCPYGHTFRSAARPFAEGEAFSVSGMTATILGVDSSGDATEIRYCFDDPLESGAYRIVCFDASGLRTFTPPGAGEAVTLPAYAHPMRLGL